MTKHFKTPDDKLWQQTQTPSILLAANISNLVYYKDGEEIKVETPIFSRLLWISEEKRWAYQHCYADPEDWKNEDIWKTDSYYSVGEIVRCDVTRRKIELPNMSII